MQEMAAEPPDQTQVDVETSAWAENENPLDDPEERRVLYAALDSFR